MTDDRQDRLRTTSPSEAEERVQKDPAELVAVVAREMAEPRDGVAPTPVTILLLFFVLAGWGGYYIANESGGFRADVYDENFREGREDAEAPKVEDPMVQGRRTVQCLYAVPPGNRSRNSWYLPSARRVRDRCWR